MSLLASAAVVLAVLAGAVLTGDGDRAPQERPASPPAAAAAAAGDPAARARICDRVAAPLGAPRSDGVLPGAQALVRRLRRGETGCLRGGRYAEDVSISGRRIVLRSAPGERALVAGRLWVRGGAYRVRIARLALDGRNPRDLPSPTVNGDRVTFSRVDVTNHHTAICFILGGDDRYGRAEGTVIRFSRIHRCGVRPSRNTNHGIYISAADNTKILGNVIVDNTDRGIQLYPDAQRTLIEGNVIAGNGEGIIFSGAFGVSSDDNLVRRNVISDSRIRANVESFYPRGTPAGVGNLVLGNCLHGGRGRVRLEPGDLGFAARGNVYADPRYRDPAAGDYRVARSSPCHRVLAAGRAAARRAR